MKTELLKRYGIKSGTTYACMDFVPTLQYDELRLQQAVPGAEEEQTALRGEFNRLAYEIDQLAVRDNARIYRKTNTRSTPKRRKFIADALRTARAVERDVFTPAERERCAGEIAAKQQRQAEIIRLVREINAAAITRNRNEAKARREAESEAIAAGRFWECDEGTLKRYFSVPFSKRKLVDVSERFRAALFVEVDVSVDAQWGHGLEPTDRGYLCGIDDNHEEWGRKIILPWPGWSYYSRVTEAMAELFSVSEGQIQNPGTQRQGDILFLSDSDDFTTEATAVESYEPMPGHQITGKCLICELQQGIWIWCATECTCTHSTHQQVELPAGSAWWCVNDEAVTD